jgi:uncharacterized protein (DUF302 family)
MKADPNSGIITFDSPWSFDETTRRIEAELDAKNVKLFARIDQAAEAAAFGLVLRPTVMFIFGDPRKGTPLMNSSPTLGLDLPLKALIWESSSGKPCVGLNSPEFLQERHGLPVAPFPEVIRLFGRLLKDQSEGMQ